MRLRSIMLSIVSALFIAPAATAGLVLPPSPVGEVTADGSVFPIQFEFVEEEGVWFAPHQTLVNNERFVITFNGIFDPDPALAYGLTVTDFGAPSSFGASFSMPIVSTPSPTEVQASVSAGINDFTGNGVSITPTLADFDGDSTLEIQAASAGVPLVNMGVDVGPAASFGPGASGAQYTYGPFSTPVLTGPALGPYTVLKVDLGFMLSGGGDIAALTGFARIDEKGGGIPEPSTIALCGIGLAIIAVRGIRRRN